MNNLYLIATQHFDLVRGPIKLGNVYERIQPDILLSETCQESLLRNDTLTNKFVDDLGRYTKNSKGLEDLRRWFSSTSGGFEYNFNQEYSQSHGIPNYLVDSPNGSDRLFYFAEYYMKEAIRNVEEKGTFNSERFVSYLRRSVGNPSPNIVRDYWNMVKRDENSFMGELRLLISRLVNKRIGKPDKHMAQRIREIYDPHKVIAFPVGMLHCSDSITRSTLYSRIKDLHPIRIPLVE